MMFITRVMLQASTCSAISVAIFGSRLSRDSFLSKLEHLFDNSPTAQTSD